MKKFVMTIRKFFSALSTLLSRNHFISQIHGTIVPPEGVKKVWAINDNDAVFVIPESGNFSIAVKAGKWKLHVEARDPYMYAVVENIRVEERGYANAGVIRLRSI